jgi:hypothetical protein
MYVKKVFKQKNYSLKMVYFRPDLLCLPYYFRPVVCSNDGQTTKEYRLKQKFKKHPALLVFGQDYIHAPEMKIPAKQHIIRLLAGILALLQKTFPINRGLKFVRK